MNISYFKESTLKKSIRNISFSDVMECMKEESGRAKAGLLAKRLKGATLLCTSTFALQMNLRKPAVHLHSPYRSHRLQWADQPRPVVCPGHA